MTRIPLFPLGSVLFPGLPLPLHVFEERYRRMVRDLEAQPPRSRRFGVIGIRAGSEVGTQQTNELYDVGCVAELRRVVAHDDGRYDLLAVGVRRFRLLSVVDDNGLAIGDVEELDEPDSVDDDGLATRVRTGFATYVRALQETRGITDGVVPDLPSAPAALSFAVASSALLSTAQRQSLLAAASVADRLRLELTVLSRETNYARGTNTLPGVVLPRPPAHPN